MSSKLTADQRTARLKEKMEQVTKRYRTSLARGNKADRKKRNGRLIFFAVTFFQHMIMCSDKTYKIFLDTFEGVSEFYYAKNQRNLERSRDVSEWLKSEREKASPKRKSGQSAKQPVQPQKQPVQPQQQVVWTKEQPLF